MTNQRGLEVTVNGDLPEQVLAQISSAVRRAVRDEVAKIDLLRDYREEELTGRQEERLKGLTTHKPIMGLIYIPPNEKGL